MTDTIARIQAALHPLQSAPAGECWNLVELHGLLSATPPVSAAVLVGMVPRPGGLQVLLTRRTQDLRHHPGQVSFPGGRVEAGDVDARATAIRETHEEVGIPASQIRPLGYLDPVRTVTGFRVLPLVALITPDYVATPDPREVDDVFEVSFDYLMAPANLRRTSLDIGGRPRSVLEFIDPDAGGRRIWGVSASILLNLRERMESAQ
jgi:8-oxo-dGTP pyrophosphatase MutT (NUDIX family)